MVIIHSFEDNFISIEIPSSTSISLASSILSKLKEDIYIDWLFILEELDETVGGIDGKRINIHITKDPYRDGMIVVSVEDYDLVAVIPS
ncbi:MAG: hypothetical protein GXO45_05295 [Aquificae bacterium]|nr:hypothetical protein [Aquificota bacterium]